MPDQQFPTIMLAHNVGRSHTETTIVDHYSLQPIEIPRPNVGVTTGGVACHTCGEVVEVRVFPASKIRRLRREWLAISLVSWLLTGLMGALLVVAHNVESLWLLGSSLVFFGVFSSPAMLAYRNYKKEDGVRMRDQRSRFATLFFKRHDTLMPTGPYPTAEILKAIKKTGKVPEAD